MNRVRNDHQQLFRVRIEGLEPQWYYWVGFIPIWLINLRFKPFLSANHPWKHEKMSLHSWVYRGTDLSFRFGLAFWMDSIVFLALILRLIYKLT